MSAVLYNQDDQWGIPGYIWPTVLGVSLAAHLSFLIYGLPEIPWQPDEPPVPHEAEIVLEGGGLVFDAVSAVETRPQETRIPDTASRAQPVETPVSQNQQAALSPVQPLKSELLQPVAPRPEIPKTSSAASVQKAGDVAATVVKAQDVTAVAVEAPSKTEPVDVATAAPVEKVPQVATPAASTTVATESVALSSPAAPVVALAPTAKSGVRIQASEVPVASSPVVLSSKSSKAAGAVRPEVQTSIPKATVQTPANAVVVHKPSTAVQAVTPAEQQIAALRPTESELSLLGPTEPVSSSVPEAPKQTDSTPNVLPTELASIDPLAKVTDYVSGYDAGECAHLTVMSAGTDTAAVTAFGAGIAPFAVFDQKFSADQGYEAKIQVRLVTRQQCALLDALGLSDGVEAAGLVELDQTVVRSGTRVAGVVQRDLPIERIAVAEAAGLELDGKGPPELYLIDDAGQIHDGRDFILPASNAVTAGGWRFAIPVTLISSEEQETALVLAIWNRPKARQPSRFGKLPPSRVAVVLAEPGVYSLSAFKVSR